MTDHDGARAPDRRAEAVRELESAFGEVLVEFRRVYADAADAVSPGMLPATYKVLAAIDRAGSITASSLAEQLVSDKGQLSRAVSELESLGLIERSADPSDGRIRRISVSRDGHARLDVARREHRGRMREVLDAWPLASIEQLAAMLHALAVGETPKTRSADETRG